MKRLLVILPALTLAAIVSTACGGGSSDTSNGKASDGPLQAATAIDAARASSAAVMVSPGAAGALSDGVSITLTDFTIAGDETGPWVTANVHVENRGSEDAEVPNIGIVCANSSPDSPGGYQAASTIGAGDSLPAGSYRDGAINLLAPGDSRTGDTVPQCQAPAYVEADPLVTYGVPVSVRVPIPASVVEQLNAKIGTH